MPKKPRAKKPSEPVRTSAIELFFDLVFVYTITQLTHLVGQSRGPLDLLGAFLILVLIWWMYAGYVWLTNATGAGGAMCFSLIAAMAGFLVMALALPSFFTRGGPAFGLAYLFVVCLHAGSFAAYGGRAAWGPVAGVLAMNATVAGLAIAAGSAAPEQRWIYLLAGASVFILSTLLRQERGFSVQPEHFAERHGLVILIALGESVVGLGAGLEAEGLAQARLLDLALALILLASFWWAYFDRDDSRAEHLLVTASPERRSRMALLGYWYAHLPMIVGVVLVAAGLRQGLGTGAWVLGAGLAFFFAGSAAFRAEMGVQPWWPRLVGAGLALLLVLLGWGSLGACVLLSLALLAWERWMEADR